MEIDEKIKVGIGTKETEKLKPAKVKVVTVDVSPPKDKEGNIVKNKQGKELTDKVTFGCKHPDKEEIIELSRAKVERNEKLKESGIWFQQDEDGLLPKNSVLLTVLKHYGAKNIEEMNNKELDTIDGDEGFLCIKAY